MSVYVDSSALVALLNSSDRYHPAAKAEWQRLAAEGAQLTISSVTAIEAHAIVQSRSGITAVADLHAELLGLMELIWVDEATYRRAVAEVFAAGRKDLSLVDCVSFLVMRDLGITQVFTFDPHFAEEGFEVLPG